jgi:alpha-glucosidase (family GH31 glycosyl hydrolase)
MYDAHNDYQLQPNWWLKNKEGETDLKKGTTLKRYDLSNPAVRNWWTDVAKKAVIEGIAMVFLWMPFRRLPQKQT